MSSIMFSVVKGIVVIIPAVVGLALTSHMWWTPVLRFVQLTFLVFVNVLLLALLYYVRVYHRTRCAMETPPHGVALPHPQKPQPYCIRDEEVYLCTLREKMWSWNEPVTVPTVSLPAPPPSLSRAGASMTSMSSLGEHHHLVMGLYPFPSDRCRQLVHAMIHSLSKDYLLPTFEARNWDRTPIREIEKHATSIIYRLVLKLSAIDWTQFIGFVLVRELHQHCRCFKNPTEASRNPYLFHDSLSERNFVNSLSARLVDSLVAPSVAHCPITRQFCIDVCSDIVLLSPVNQLSQPANIQYWLHTFLQQRMTTKSTSSTTERRTTPYRNYEELYEFIHDTNNIEELKDLLKHITKEIARLQLLQEFQQQKKSNLRETSFPGSGILRSLFPSMGSSESATVASSSGDTTGTGPSLSTSLTGKSRSRATANTSSLDCYLNQLRNCRKLIGLRLYQDDKKRLKTKEDASFASIQSVPAVKGTPSSIGGTLMESDDDSGSCSDVDVLPRRNKEPMNAVQTAVAAQYRKSMSLPSKKASSSKPLKSGKFGVGSSLLTTPALFRKMVTYIGSNSTAQTSTLQADSSVASSSGSIKGAFKRALSNRPELQKDKQNKSLTLPPRSASSAAATSSVSSRKDSPQLILFSEILSTEEGREALKRFLKQSQDLVLVEFVQMVDSLLHSEDFEHLFLGRQIWQTYIKCSRPVFDFPPEVLRAIQDFLQGNDNAHGFGEARYMVCHHLEQVHYQRFYLSSHYSTLMKQLRTPKRLMKTFSVEPQASLAMVNSGGDSIGSISSGSIIPAELSRSIRANTIEESDVCGESSGTTLVTASSSSMLDADVESDPLEPDHPESPPVVMRTKRPAMLHEHRKALGSSFTETDVLLPPAATWLEHRREARYIPEDSEDTSHTRSSGSFTADEMAASDFPNSIGGDEKFLSQMKQNLEEKIVRKENALKALHAAGAIATVKNKDQIEGEIVQLHSDLDALRDEANAVVSHAARVRAWWDHMGSWRPRVATLYRSRGLIQVAKENIRLDILVEHDTDPTKRWKVTHTLQELYELRNELLEMCPNLKSSLSLPSAKRIFLQLSLNLDKADQQNAHEQLCQDMDHFLELVLSHEQLQMAERVFHFFCTAALSFHLQQRRRQQQESNGQNRSQDLLLLSRKATWTEKASSALGTPRKRANSRLLSRKSSDSSLPSGGKPRKGVPVYRRPGLVSPLGVPGGHHTYHHHHTLAMGASAASSGTVSGTNAFRTRRRTRSQRSASLTATVQSGARSGDNNNLPLGVSLQIGNSARNVAGKSSMDCLPDAGTSSTSSATSFSYQQLLNPDTASAFAAVSTSCSESSPAESIPLSVDSSLIDRFKQQMMQKGKLLFPSQEDTSAVSSSNEPAGNDVLLIPLIELFEDLCQQRNSFNFPRRSLMQLVQSIFAESWSRDLAGAIEEFLTEGTLYASLQWLANAYFPSASSSSSSSQTVTGGTEASQPASSGSNPSGPVNSTEAASAPSPPVWNPDEWVAKKEVTKRMLWDLIPDLLKKLLGQSNLADGVGFLYELLHSQLANKALLFRLLEATVRYVVSQEPGL